MHFCSRARLLAGIASLSFFVADAAMAQQGPANPVTQTGPVTIDAADAPGAANEDIVVTGSILRRTDTAGTSPITTITTEALDQRGINTVQDAVQQLASNNGPALVNSFTANGAFAGGASSVSLRGLSTNSTLVLFDGLRAAYFPLADDGSRNFVDLNTIPDDIVDRIEVLRDGASSSYGADAIAGVVNIITKKSFRGVAGRAEAGISEDGIGANQRLTLTAGTGDIDEQGFNAYLSGFFIHQDAVYNRDLPFPYNSSDLRSICSERTGTRVCGPDLSVNGLDGGGRFPNTGFGINSSTLFVQPYDATNSAAQGRYQLLNPAAGCRDGGTLYRPTPDELAGSRNASLPTALCRQDLIHDYGPVSPLIERFGASARFSTKLNDETEAYVQINFQQATTSFTGNPASIRSNANTGILYRRFSTATGAGAVAPGSGVLTLPVYVCAEGRGSANGLETGCNATNGRLNPNNPFAAQGQVARLVGLLPGTLTENETRSRVYRAALGISGQVFGSWDYNFNATAMHTDLRLRTNGFVYIQNLLDAIARGSYDFVTPENNDAAARSFLSPENITNDSSDLYQAQLTVGRTLAQLPGGPLQLGVGGTVFYEAVDAPSANDDYNGPTQRYFTLNAFGTKGSRVVTAGFAELNAPVLEQLEFNLSGRYDHYSSGQGAFSPKAGVKITPIRQLALRGTFSRGFRIPSFGEANALPTTGFVPQEVSNLPQSFLSQYGSECRVDNPAGCPGYVTNYAIGTTTLASPGLKPEKSRSLTAGILFEPIRNVSFTVDYFNIKKTGAITAADTSPAVAAYYAGQPIPEGFSVIADAPDPNNPTALPRIAFVESQLINANTIKAEGIDFGANARFDLGPVVFTTNLDASLLLELSTTFPDGSKQEYVDTLGNFQLTAGSGTFRWRGNWQNTLDFGKVAVTGSLNYVSGYDLSAEDAGTGYRDCGLAPAFTGCRVDSYITADLNAVARVSDRVSVYVNVLNVLGDLPDLDPVTYGANNYNPVQAGTNVLGRQFRVGARFGF